MGLFLQQLLSGIATGMLYGLLGVALMTIYEGTKVLNFGQGGLATLSAYGAWQIQRTGINFWLALILAVIGSFVLGVVIERVLIRPIQDAAELTLLVVTAALLLLTTAVITVIWGPNGKGVSSPFGQHVWHLGDTVITANQVGTAAIGIVASSAAWLLLSHTRTGLVMRATAMNRASAEYLGIDAGRVLGLGWGIAAALGAVAGIFSAPVLQLNPDMMTGAILMTFAGLILGGIGSFGGVLLGGVIVGVATNLGFTYIGFVSSGVADLVPFALILVVLLLRPQGLFGRVEAVRS